METIIDEILAEFDEEFAASDLAGAKKIRAWIEDKLRAMQRELDMAHDNLWDAKFK